VIELDDKWEERKEKKARKRCFVNELEGVTRVYQIPCASCIPFTLFSV